MPPPSDTELAKNPLLIALGERVRDVRARKGVTRKALAAASGVSERHLANLELGVGNASIVVLAQVAQALGCGVAELVADDAGRSPEHDLILAQLQGRSEEQLGQVRRMLSALLKTDGGNPSIAAPTSARKRIALVGLRGAGKSTLGQMLAEALNLPFIELNREIERVAGCSLTEIQGLWGQAGYRRHERRALHEVIARHTEAVIATPGGMVSDPATYQLLLSECLTVWLQAQPTEHMQRVIQQGDLRPMADHSGNRAAMDDLQRILHSRVPMYAKADLSVDTSGLSVDETLQKLLAAVHAAA